MMITPPFGSSSSRVLVPELTRVALVVVVDSSVVVTSSVVVEVVVVVDLGVVVDMVFRLRISPVPRA
jgi:hypothetical protein